MQFKPIGGFPSIVRIGDKNISEKTLESRGFATTNIVSISNIIDAKKKENLFTAFGSEEEDGIDTQSIFNRTPHDYDDIGMEDK